MNVLKGVIIFGLVLCASCSKFSGPPETTSPYDTRRANQHCAFKPERFNLFFQENIQEDIACLASNFELYIAGVKRPNHAYLEYPEVERFIKIFYQDLGPHLQDALKLLFKINGLIFNQPNDHLYLGHVKPMFKVLEVFNQTAARMHHLQQALAKASPVEFSKLRQEWTDIWANFQEKMLPMFEPAPSSDQGRLNLMEAWQTVQFYLERPTTPTAIDDDLPAPSLAGGLFRSLKFHLVGGNPDELTYSQTRPLLTNLPDWSLLYFDLLYTRPQHFHPTSDYYALMLGHLAKFFAAGPPAAASSENPDTSFTFYDDLWPWIGLTLRLPMPYLPAENLQGFVKNIEQRVRDRLMHPQSLAVNVGPLEHLAANQIPDQLKAYFRKQLLYLCALEYFGHWQIEQRQAMGLPLQVPLSPLALEEYWSAHQTQEDLAHEFEEQLTPLLAPLQATGNFTELLGRHASLYFSYPQLRAVLKNILGQHLYDVRHRQISWQHQNPLLPTEELLTKSIFYHWSSELIVEFYQDRFSFEAQPLTSWPSTDGNMLVFSLTPTQLEPIFADLDPIIKSFNLPAGQDAQGLIQAVLYVADLLLFASNGDGKIDANEAAQLWPLIYGATELGKIFWETLPNFCLPQDNPDLLRTSASPSASTSPTALLKEGPELNPANFYRYDRACWHEHFPAMINQLAHSGKIHLANTQNFWDKLAADPSFNRRYLFDLENLMAINPRQDAFALQDILLTSAALLVTESFFLRFNQGNDLSPLVPPATEDAPPPAPAVFDDVLAGQELDDVFHLVCPTIKRTVLPGQYFDDEYARDLFDYVLEKKVLPLTGRRKFGMYLYSKDWFGWWSKNRATLTLDRLTFLELAMLFKNDPQVVEKTKRSNFPDEINAPPPGVLDGLKGWMIRHAVNARDID